VTVGLLVANAGFAAGNIVTYFGALRFTTVAVAVLTHYLAPVLVAVAAPWVEGERVRGARLAALVATAGLVLVLEPWAEPIGRGELWLGAGLGAASAFFYAGNVFVARRLEPRIGASATIAYHALIAALLLAPLLVVDSADIDGRALGLLALGAAVPGALAGVLFVTGLGQIGSSRAAVLAYLEPLVAVVIGWSVWGEALGPPAGAGAVLIVGAGIRVSVAPAHRVR
jgi:drug/metabolite transporter (DMT)-like permease